MLPVVLLAAFVGCAPPVRAEAPAVSSSLEQRLDALLADILGPRRAHAFVRLIPAPADAGAAQEARGEQPGALWDRLESRLKSAPPVLPGYPAPRNLREEAVRELVREEQAPARADAGQALDVTLVVDGSVSDGPLRAASDAVARAVGLDAARGDSLRVARAPLAPSWSKAWSDIAYGAPAFAARSALAVGALAGLAGLWVLGAWPRRRRAARRALPEPPSGVLLEAAPPSPPSDLIFDIEPAQVPRLLEALAGHPPEHAALVVPHLRPAAREALLCAMPPSEAAAVVAALLRMRPVDPARLELLRARLERRLGRVVGGVPRAVEALRSLPSGLRREIVERLRESDAEAAAALQAAAPLEDPGPREAS